MAGDWIAMRTDLADDPAVIRLASLLTLPRPHIVGLLHRFWSWADGQTCKGKIGGVTCADLDAIVSHDGFANALKSVGWLCVTLTGITFPKFGRWNAQPAKRRVLTARRVRAHRDKKRTLTRRIKDHIPARLRAEVFARDNYACVYCGRTEGQTNPLELPTDGLLTIDHVIPESREGTISACNLVTCCMKCNRAKTNRTPEEAGFDKSTQALHKRYTSVTKSLPQDRTGQDRTEQIEKRTSLAAAQARPQPVSGASCLPTVSEPGANRPADLEVQTIGARNPVAKSGVTEEPALPDPDADGNYPAVAYARASLARSIMQDRAKPRGTPSSPPVPRKFRPRDPIWDSLCEAMGLHPDTKTEKAHIGKVVRDLKLKSATPDEIRRVVVQCTQEWEGKAFSPDAVVKWFDRFRAAKPKWDPGDVLRQRWAEEDARDEAIEREHKAKAIF